MNEVPGFPSWHSSVLPSQREWARTDYLAEVLNGSGKRFTNSGTTVLMGAGGVHVFDQGPRQCWGRISGQSSSDNTLYSFIEVNDDGIKTATDSTSGNGSDTTQFNLWEVNGNTAVPVNRNVRVYAISGEENRWWFDYCCDGSSTFTGGVISGDTTFTGTVTASSTVTLNGLLYIDGGAITYNSATNTLTFNSITLALNTVTTTGYLNLFNLTDPNADRIPFWDDSAGQIVWLTPGSNLTITGTTINATSGTNNPAGSDYLVQYYDGGAFGADVGMYYDKNGGALTLLRGDIGGSGTRGLDILRDESTDAYPAGIRLQKTNGAAGNCATSEAVGAIEFFAGTSFGREIVKVSVKTNSGDATSGYLDIQTAKAGTLGSRLTFDEDKIGFNGSSPIAKPTITGVRTGTLGQLQAVVAQMLQALEDRGDWTDSTT